MLGFNTGLMSDIGRPRTVAAQGGDDYTEALTVTLAPVVQPGVNAAPSPVWFEVADVTGCEAGNPGAGEARIPKFHNLTYVWDFGDAANATPSTAAALRMPAAWKDINRGYGMQAVHVYSAPAPIPSRSRPMNAARSGARAAPACKSPSATRRWCSPAAAPSSSTPAVR